MFYDIVFFLSPEAEAAGAKVSLVAGKYVVTKAVATTIQAIHNARPPKDDSALVAQLQTQVVQLTTDLAACQQAGGAMPTITGMTVLPASLPAGGGDVVVDATVTDADSLTLDGVPVTLPATVAVTADHVFTLVAIGGSAQATAGVTVAAAPLAQTIDSFTAAPNPLSAGQAVTVAWATSNASVVTLNGATVAGSGTLQDSPVADKSYTLVATGSASPATSAVNVVVQAAPSPTVVQSVLLDLSKLVVFDGYHATSRYERCQRLVVNPVTLPFHGTNLIAGGSLRALTATSYSLKVDGVVKATATVAAGATGGNFVAPAMTPGDHQLDIVCGSGETCPTWFVAIGTFAQTTVPVYDGSFGITHGVGSTDTAISNPVFTQHWSIAPIAAPTPRPLPARVMTPFATALTPSQLYRRLLVPVTQGDIHRQNVNKDGIVSTANRQAYFFGDVSPLPPSTQWGALISKYPGLALLDGPRGVGTGMMDTHLEPGGTMGGVWACDPWRFKHYSADGTVKTMIGYRDAAVPQHWEDGPRTQELLGDWSALTVKGFHELWGMAWRKSTLALDPNAPPINGQQPHLVGPQALFADTQNNRVLRATWSPIDRSIPAVMTAFATGLDCWDVVEGGDKVYISWRGEHRVAEYDAATGAFIRNMVTGAALAHVDVNRVVVRDATLAQIQAQPCVAPEGLFLQDGWLYFGSSAMAQVKRVNLTTGVIEFVCAPLIDGNSHFIKISVSDGTCGPRGTVFTATWSNARFGLPQAFLPGGAEWTFNQYGPFANGAGGRWDAMGYPTGVGSALGKILCGSSYEGVAEYSKALTTDAVKDEAKYVAGRNQFWAKGYALLHGELGFGYFGLSLPLGETPEMDYFLNWNLS